VVGDGREPDDPQEGDDDAGDGGAESTGHAFRFANHGKRLRTPPAAHTLKAPRADASGVFRRLRENGPALLVPLAWGFVAAVHLGAVGSHPLLVAHVVMTALLIGFAALSWAEMATGALRAWRAVIVVGAGATLLGTVGLLRAVPSLLAVSLYGWLLLPGPALLYPARLVDDRAPAYAVGGALSLLGAAVYAGASLAGDPASVRIAGLAVAGAGQTVGILAATLAEGPTPERRDRGESGTREPR